MSLRDESGIEYAIGRRRRCANYIRGTRNFDGAHSIGDAIEKEAGMPVNILDVTFISVIRPHCVVPGRIV